MGQSVAFAAALDELFICTFVRISHAINCFWQGDFLTKMQELQLLVILGGTENDFLPYFRGLLIKW
ncbi:hypothetical protein SGRA_1034 [Saprospira grandis str. Lewin]|uniref:Uncharacterized protein n=1 Tax=Saprospira grandis (strain Lewin) TaxID=984262 RepID=H6L3C2_SAPGL|nr:hypothetical protein SGRA_1034 [Saprospira grandis str. Lewin]